MATCTSSNAMLRKIIRLTLSPGGPRGPAAPGSPLGPLLPSSPIGPGAP